MKINRKIINKKIKETAGKSGGNGLSVPLVVSVLLMVPLFFLLEVFPGEETNTMTHNSMTQQENEDTKNGVYNQQYNPLSPEEARVILRGGTERPFSGRYDDHKAEGFYTCKRCDAPLYRSADKFDSGCGWPAFDDEVEGAVRRLTDADGMRTEIRCKRCDGHLGHVFLGEGLTPKNVRHCVNSISMNFVPMENTRRAVFASGCFWGTEYHFQRTRGVLSTTVGYTGGETEKPGYRQVCSGETGHAEAVEVAYDPSMVDYGHLVRLFFETHDPTQVNRQGPDIGTQYRSEIFYLDAEQKRTAEKMSETLRAKGYRLATRLTAFTKFWSAEEYHQDYYLKKSGTPYCHVYTPRF